MTLKNDTEGHAWLDRVKALPGWAHPYDLGAGGFG
jgi:hypothetical protein